MIIMHDFGDGDRVTDVYVAELEDGTYSVKCCKGNIINQGIGKI